MYTKLEKKMAHCDTHLYPANIFISEDFPAPCGPITAVSSPDGNIPDMFLRIRVSAEIILKVKKTHISQIQSDTDCKVAFKTFLTRCKLLVGDKFESVIVWFKAWHTFLRLFLLS